MGRKNKQDEGWMDYLRERPKMASELIEEAKNERIAEINEIYSDVITAYNATKFQLDGIVAGMVALKNRQEKKGGLVGGWSKELQQAHEDGEKEWNRLSYEFDVKHGRR